MQMLSYQKVIRYMERLKLTHLPDVLDNLAEQASKKNLSYLEFVELLLEEEASYRYQKNLEVKIKLSRLPARKRMEDFDFKFQPSIDRKLIAELETLRFIDNVTNVVFLGPPGVGKSHLGLSLVLKALENGYSAYFSTMDDLTSTLKKNVEEGRYDIKMRYLIGAKLLMIDEVGFTPMDRFASNLFFQLVSRRYERGSIIITSNKSYGEWGELFGDSVLASAILDRLLHHSITVNIRGNSYRLKEKVKAGMIFTEKRNLDNDNVATEVIKSGEI